MHGTFWSSFISLFIKGKKIGNTKQILHFLYYKKIEIPNYEFNQIDKNLLFISGICKKLLPNIKINPFSEEKQDVMKKLKQLNINFNKLILINPTSSQENKNWIINNWIILIQELKKLKYDIIIIGKMDKTLKAILNKVNNISYIETTIGELYFLITLSKIFITVDSFPMHIAKTTKTKTISLFGPTSPVNWGWFSNYSHIIYHKIHCSPCNKIKNCKNPECMITITTEEILKKI